MSEPTSPQPAAATVAATSTIAPAAPAMSPASDQIDIEQFMKVKLRVARIESAEAVPKSKKLLKLQVDLGPLGKRQVLSGISQHYTPESLLGKRVIIVANLKPATMMGLESQGMLLAGSSADGTTLRIVEPSPDLPEGAEVR